MKVPASSPKSTKLDKLKNRVRRFRDFAQKHRKLTLFSCGALLIALFIAMAYWVSVIAAPGQIDYKVIAIKKDKNVYSPLTGKKLADKNLAKRPVTAIIIENSPDARPQSGLKQSGIVYEAIAEGGITRFLALYQEDQPGLIGPVRSLRPYYVDWLTPYQPSVAHVGGSAEALKLIRNGSYRDIDQMRFEGSYWRSNDRYPPHNVYTNFKRLNALNKKQGYKTSNFTAFDRVDGKTAKNPNATKISVQMSGPDFNSSYQYNAKANNYTRSQAGAVHKDREKGNITPSVVIVIKAAMNTRFDDGPREHYKTTGTGEAHVFQNGTVIKATWSKKDRSSQIQFLDSDKKPIELVRGQTWISVVPSSSGGVSWR